MSPGLVFLHSGAKLDLYLFISWTGTWRCPWPSQLPFPNHFSHYYPSVLCAAWFHPGFQNTVAWLLYHHAFWLYVPAIRSTEWTQNGKLIHHCTSRTSLYSFSGSMWYFLWQARGASTNFSLSNHQSFQPR